MSEENIRRRVVNSFRKAIDFEQKNNDLVGIWTEEHFVKVNLDHIFELTSEGYVNTMSVWRYENFVFQEAYRKYLEGLALVAAALQQDADSSWSLGNPSLTPKERRSLIGFAKQSVDRLVLLIEKQGMTVVSNL